MRLSANHLCNVAVLGFACFITLGAAFVPKPIGLFHGKATRALFSSQDLAQDGVEITHEQSIEDRIASAAETVQKRDIVQAPGTTPKRSYFFPEVFYNDRDRFSLPDNGINEREKIYILSSLARFANVSANNFAGYQSTSKLNTKHLAPFIEYSINNIGDSFANPEATKPVSPLADGYFGLNCKWVERSVLDFFARKWNAKVPRTVQQDKDPEWLESYWGYVLSMGSTEGNLMALRSARDYLKGRQLLFGGAGRLAYQDCDGKDDNAFNPVLLYSNASHYSIKKLAQMLEFEAVEINTNDHGEIDLEDLKTVAEYFAGQQGRPVAVNFNYGTTWTGGLDNVGEGIKVVKDVLRKYNMMTRTIYRDNGRQKYERNGFWFHCDGALGAGYATFAKYDSTTKTTLPEFDFRTGIQSIALSGHKWPGAPWPTGIYMTKNKFMLTNDVPAYVGSLDSTLAGSRSGIASIFLWDWIASQSDKQREQDVQTQFEVAEYALHKIKYEWDPKATRAPGSIMVVARMPPLQLKGAAEFLNKHSLAVTRDKVKGDKFHIVCMRQVTKDLINMIVGSLKDFKKQEMELAKDGTAAAEDEVIDAGFEYDSYREGY